MVRFFAMDVCFNRREDGKLMRQVYQKPTHPSRYLMFVSHHPMDVKEGIVQDLSDRATKVSSDEATRVEEFKRVSYVIKQNGYPENFI